MSRVPRKVCELPLGTLFHYQDRPGHTFVLLGRADGGLCAEAPNLASPSALQGIYSVAESAQQFRELKVLCVDQHEELLSMLARVADAEFGFGGWPTEAEISAVLANARGAQPAEPLYYLQDTRTYVGNCPLWWAHGGRGYTTDVRQAHRYTLAEAQQQHEERDTDRPWPCADIDKLIRHTVDMQDMRRIPKFTRNTP